ncbi:MAG: hypothetical protein JWN75_108 [Candidatus Saccharibacteria bacterium]|nr:hypothetical protein [Candidatus Saccharibacteria bacterium]
MTEIDHDKAVGFQPELELNLESMPGKLVETRKVAKSNFFPAELEKSLDKIWSEDSQRHQVTVPLRPKIIDDPFYMAQLRTHELESLSDIDKVPVLAVGLPFEQDSTASSTVIGERTRDELNRRVPRTVRQTRLAVSTFMLTVLEDGTFKQFSHEDDEDNIVVSGYFESFVFDQYNQKNTIVVPLIQPRIFKPSFLSGMTLAAVRIPVLSIDDWSWSTEKN